MVSSSEFGESSAVLKLLTADLGAVRVLAKGAKRLQNGFAGPLDRGVLYRVRVVRKGAESLSLLTSSTALEAFPRVRKDCLRFSAASLFLEIAADLMRENEPHTGVFRLCAFSLKALDKAPRDRIDLLCAFFLARAVGLSGHAPLLESCAACGEALPATAPARLSPLRGGAVHPACAAEDERTRRLSPEARRTLSLLASRPAASVLEADLPPGPLRDLRHLLLDWLEATLERRFRAAPGLAREIAREVSRAR